MTWIPLSDFGKGLNLASGPLDPSWAIDCLDVTYGRAIKSRPGWGYLTQNAQTYTKLHPWHNTAGTKYLLAARSGNTDVLDNAGATAYTEAKTFTSAASFGSPGNEVVYLADGTNTVFKFTGTAFSAPGASQPKPRYVTVKTDDNRLVATGFTAGANGPAGATVSESTVHFSDELAPETWTANSYVQLAPGDGEKIQGCVTWRSMVFVFKESRFWVFTDTTTDSGGDPKFNRREVSGAGLAAPNAVAVSPEGVYFLASDGIYFTNGGNPERLLEQEMGPIFGTTNPRFFSSRTVNQSAISGSAAEFHNGRLYMAVPMNGSSSNNRVIVWDRAFGWWSVYSLAANDLANWNPDDAEELLIAQPTAEVIRHADSYTTDNGQPIAAFSRQAWLDAGQRMSVRQFKVWGDGEVSCSVATDYAYRTGTEVVADLTSQAEPWGDGVGDADWGTGVEGDFEWGPDGVYRHKTVRGLRSRGFIFSFQFSNNSSSTPLAVEQASVQLLGGVNQEQ